MDIWYIVKWLKNKSAAKYLQPTGILQLTNATALTHQQGITECRKVTLYSGWVKNRNE